MTDSLPVVSRLHEDQGAPQASGQASAHRKDAEPVDTGSRTPRPDDDGYDYLRLRVVDPDLRWTEQARRLLDKLFLERAALRASLGERDATITALRADLEKLQARMKRQAFSRDAEISALEGEIDSLRGSR